jgi:hypothetical protein
LFPLVKNYRQYSQNQASNNAASGHFFSLLPVVAFVPVPFVIFDSLFHDRLVVELVAGTFPAVIYPSSTSYWLDAQTSS